MFIKTDNCALRALEPSDANLLYVWENERSLWSYSNTTVPFSKLVIEEFAQSAHQDVYANRQLRLMVISLPEQLTIGCADIFDFDPFHLRCGLGIYIHQEHRGKGYAASALQMVLEYVFGTLLLRQVYAEVSEQNTASLKLFLASGFVQTGLKLNWHRVSESNFENVVLLQLQAPSR